MHLLLVAVLLLAGCAGQITPAPSSYDKKTSVAISI